MESKESQVQPVKNVEQAMSEPAFVDQQKRILDLLKQLEEYERTEGTCSLLGSSSGAASPVTYSYTLTWACLSNT